MKTFLTILCATAVLFTTGCSSDDVTYRNENVTFDMSYKIDGMLYKDMIPTSTIDGTHIEITGYQGFDDSYAAISLSVPDMVKKGTYTVTNARSNNSYNAVYMYGTSKTKRAATSGSITVTNVTATYIEGTFQFTFTLDGATKTVEQGYFISDNTNY